MSNQPKGKLRPMLFSTPMVKAILAGKKTQTRRIIKPQPELIPAEDEFAFMRLDDFDARLKELQSKGYVMLQNVHGKLHALPKQPAIPGDVIWVRETFLRLDKNHIITTPFVYKANGDLDTEELRKDYIKCRYPYTWKPAIHMPFEAARLFLYVEDIYPERVKKITPEDAHAEGITLLNPDADDDEFFLYKDFKNAANYFFTPYQSFASLWKSINGDESWNSNPIVWAYKFREISKAEALEVASR